MPNVSYISQIQLPSGNTYIIKDEEARAMLTSGVHYRGRTTTALTDQATTNPIIINGESYTAVNGDLVVYKASSNDPDREFIFNGTLWDEFGIGIGTLGSLAFKNSASGTYKKATGGSVVVPKTYTFTGSAGTVTVTTTMTRVTGVTKTTKYIKPVVTKTGENTVNKVSTGTAKTFATGGVTVSVANEVLTFTAAGTDNITPVSVGAQVNVIGGVTVSLDNTAAQAEGVAVVTDVDVTEESGTVTSTGQFTPSGDVAADATETKTVTITNADETVSVS